MLLLACAACERATPAVVPPQASPNQIVVQGVVLDRWAADQHRYRATAQRARIDRGTGRVRAERIVVRAYDAAGEVSARIEAMTATGTVDGETFELSGGVRLTDARARVLEAERAAVDVGTDRFRAPAPVKLRGDNFTATGGAMDVRMSEGRVRVAGPVRARVGPAE